MKQILFFLLSLPLTTFAQYDFSSESQVQFAQSKKDTATNKKWSIVHSGVFDVRLISTDEASSWSDQGTSGAGGRGLSRFGGKDSNNDGQGDTASQRLALGQISWVTEVILDKAPLLHLHFNLNNPREDQSSTEALDLVEAFLTRTFYKKEGGEFNTRIGLLIPEISLEHNDTAWSTSYSITPSAINTWVGEEIRPLAAELSWLKEFNMSDLKLTAAVYTGNDIAGSLISWRGWALHDYQSGLNSRVRYQEQPNSPTQSGQPFDEIDGKVGLYANMIYNWDNIFELRAFYLNSNKDLSLKNVITGDVTWGLELYQIGLQWTPNTRWTIIAQAMSGSVSAETPLWEVDNNIFSSYLALSYEYASKQRFTLRADILKVDDEDNDLSDSNDQKGSALTFAYIHQLDQVQSIAFEYLSLTSERSGNLAFGDDDPSDDLIQIAYRLKY